ncbi:MAG: leucine-rich repeat domain-containing protein [Firmicutes bacterium]|nr:leucine-rich repeat domain-containing protein [Bacillota bacterium]
MKKIVLLMMIIICFTSLSIVCYAEPYSTERDSNFEYYCSIDEGGQAYALIDDYFGEKNANITSIIIPARSPGGKPVTGIQMNRDCWGDYITSITVPSSLDEVKGKFNTATALTQLFMPEGVGAIGQGAFRQCSGLTTTKEQAAHHDIIFVYSRHDETVTVLYRQDS